MLWAKRNKGWAAAIVVGLFTVGIGGILVSYALVGRALAETAMARARQEQPNSNWQSRSRASGKASANAKTSAQTPVAEDATDPA